MLELLRRRWGHRQQRLGRQEALANIEIKINHKESNPPTMQNSKTILELIMIINLIRAAATTYSTVRNISLIREMEVCRGFSPAQQQKFSANFQAQTIPNLIKECFQRVQLRINRKLPMISKIIWFRPSRWNSLFWLIPKDNHLKFNNQ